MHDLSNKNDEVHVAYVGSGCSRLAPFVKDEFKIKKVEYFWEDPIREDDFCDAVRGVGFLG